VRLNNTRQALLLLLFFFLFFLLRSLSPPSTSSCPLSQFSAGFILQPTLSLSLPSPPFSLHPSSTSSSSSYARPLPGLHLHPSWGFTFSFASLYPSRSLSSLLLFLFRFTLLYHPLPSTLACICNTHICKSLFKDDSLLFFLCMCVYEKYLVHASVSQSETFQFCELRKSSSDGRLKRDA